MTGRRRRRAGDRWKRFSRATWLRILVVEMAVETDQTTAAMAQPEHEHVLPPKTLAAAQPFMRSRRKWKRPRSASRSPTCRGL
jgi:hypothetical protein